MLAAGLSVGGCGDGADATASGAAGMGSGGTAGGSAGATTSGESGSGAATTGGGTGATTGGGGTGGGAMEPDFDSLPWETGADVGYGVARKDSQNPLGENVFIGYGGYNITLDSACAWATELYHASLHDRGVRYVYCVQGPADPTYSQLEIGNSKIVANLLTQVGQDTHFILAAAHSSGGFVAAEILQQLANGLDPQDVTANLVVYFDLDGGTGGLTQKSVERLKKAYFISARDSATNTKAPNYDVMVAGGQTYGFAGGFWELDASQAGCDAGAKWCLHMTVINTKPHDPAGAQGNLDYSDFVGRPVERSYIDAKADEAGLVP